MTSANNFQLAEAILNLPLELRELICKEYIAIKIKQRVTLGWNDVHRELLEEIPFCDKRERIVKLLLCLECDGLCAPCYLVGIKHSVLPPKYIDANIFVNFGNGLFAEVCRDFEHDLL